MINQNLFLAIACSLAVGVSGCNNADSPSNKPSKQVESTATTVSGDLKIAYVNTDTLFDKSNMLKDLEEEFIQEKLTMEGQFRSQYEKLEKDYRDAEAGASQLSQEALQILGQKLQQREQELMMQKQTMEKQLMKSEQEKNDRFYERIRVFLDEYAKENGYHMVYGYNGFGNVLYMDDQFDITQTIVEAINAQYDSEKKAAGDTAIEE